MIDKAQDYYPQSPEVLLIALARDGDQMAFQELVRRNQSMVRNLMHRLSSEEHLAEDLSQLVFVKLWQKLASIKEVKAFKGWLRKIAVNTWLAHVRKNDPLKNSDEFTEADNHQADTPGLGRDLQFALEQLPHQMRLCIVLSYQEGMSHGEIADVTETPLGTVKSNIKRGSEQLKEILAVYQGE